MPVVGERKLSTVASMERDSMYKYAQKFNDTTRTIQTESQINYSLEPGKAAMYGSTVDALREFFIEESADYTNMTPEEIQDHETMMNESFTNDIQALRESASAANYNPIIGLGLPMHKYLMLNCMFAQAVPRFVAKSPSWTETMETRYLITPDGQRIDVANQQNLIYGAFKSQNASIDVPIALPEVKTVDILDKYFHVSRTSHNLSIATHVKAVAVQEYVKVGTPIITIAGGVVTNGTASADGLAIVWKSYKAEFTPGYGDFHRVIMARPVLTVATSATEFATITPMLIVSQTNDNMFEISGGDGTIKAVMLSARYDASGRTLKSCRVDWQGKTNYVSIPEADGITVPVTPEEVKDIAATYGGLNQVTKYMSIIKDVMENVKDDDIKFELDGSYTRLDDDHRLAKTIDFAVPQGYNNDFIVYNKSTFMTKLTQFIDGLLTVLHDPNMSVTVIGRPALIKLVTPEDYSFAAPGNLGPVELTYNKTVVTSDKRVINFLSSEKMYGSDSFIVLLIPKNSNRIIYRLYDYQMYISNEIRDAENPQLPAITAFQRYKFFEYQPVQGRIMIANPSGERVHLPNINPVELGYANNDLGSVYKQYDATTGLNTVVKNQI